MNEFGIAPVTRDVTTTITVTMPSSAGSSARFGSDIISNGQSYTVNLQYGETAQFQGISQDANLNGAHIVSNYPISVFSGNIRARVDPTTSSSRDHLVHQLAPVSTWGTEFVSIPIPRVLDRGDIFTVTASESSTSVVVNIKNADGSMAPTQTLTLANPGKRTIMTL